MAILLLLATACRQDMHDQPRYEPLERSTFFDDGRSARPFVEGTVARGQLKIPLPKKCSIAATSVIIFIARLAMIASATARA
jgi:hypothetical protein